MMASFEIIPFRKSYQSQVINLIVGIQSGEFGVEINADDQPDLKEIPRYYQHGSGEFWLAVIDGQVVGTLSLLDIGKQQLALRKMFVARHYRGAPYFIAQKLLETAVQWSKNHAITDIFLGTVPSYHAAHRFYEKNGFVRYPKNKLPEKFPIMLVDTWFYHLSLDPIL